METILKHTTGVVDRMKLYIGAAAELIGVEGGTLRKWDRLGLLSPRRNAHGIREYMPEDIQRGREVLRKRLARRGSC
jgi:DNA-binding transcriptional MerR regulator